MPITRVDTVHCRGGEGPLWSPPEQALYFIDNAGRKVHRFDTATGKTTSWDMPSVITALALRASGGAVVTLRTGIHMLDFNTGALETLHPLPDPPPLVFNDGKVDQRGRFVIGACTAKTLAPEADGGLFRLDPDHSLTKLDEGIHFSNGPCWSPDGGTLYFSDSWINTVYAYDYNLENGEVGNRRTFIDTGEFNGVPDGATVDSEGRYWVALYGAGKIAAFSPNGCLEHLVDMPVKLVSSVMFGGENLDRLYVTTIERRHDKPDEVAEAGAGDLYVIDDLGARGIAEPLYAG